MIDAPTVNRRQIKTAKCPGCGEPNRVSVARILDVGEVECQGCGATILLDPVFVTSGAPPDHGPTPGATITFRPGVAPSLPAPLPPPVPRWPKTPSATTARKSAGWRWLYVLLVVLGLLLITKPIELALFAGSLLLLRAIIRRHPATSRLPGAGRTGLGGGARIGWMIGLVVLAVVTWFGGLPSGGSSRGAVGESGGRTGAAARPTAVIAEEAKAEAVDLLAQAIYKREEGQLGLALELVRQAEAKWPGYAEAGQFRAEAAPEATGTAQAILAANDAAAQDHMGAANSFRDAVRARPIMAAAAIEEYEEVLGFAPNKFVAPARTEIARLAPTATRAVQQYFASATAQASATAVSATATARAAVAARQPTPAPVLVTGGGGGGGSGCGSRGGPGFRLANGKCASWRDVR